MYFSIVLDSLWELRNFWNDPMGRKLAFETSKVFWRLRKCRWKCMCWVHENHLFLLYYLQRRPIVQWWTLYNCFQRVDFKQKHCFRLSGLFRPVSDQKVAWGFKYSIVKNVTLGHQLHWRDLIGQNSVTVCSSPMRIANLLRYLKWISFN